MYPLHRRGIVHENQAVKGFHDVLPGESARWGGLETTRGASSSYGYPEIRIPIVERAELFRRSVGETTDIVEKEMYAFDGPRREPLTLRPEGTASVVRAYVEHALARARAGREALLLRADVPPRAAAEGPPAPVLADRRRGARARRSRRRRRGAAAAPRPAARVRRRHGAEVQINSLGDATCRPAYRDALVAWGQAHTRRAVRRLQRAASSRTRCACSTARSRAARAIARRRRAWSTTSATPAPSISTRVLALLDAPGRRARARSRDMVRGLDYYCRTAFEVVRRGSARRTRSAAAAATTAWCGISAGPTIAGDRLRARRRAARHGARRRDAATAAAPESFVAPLGAAAEARARAPGAPAAARRRCASRSSPAQRSLKSQMRHAGKLGARYVVIFGEDELASGPVTVRDMGDASATGWRWRSTGGAAELRAALAAADAATGSATHDARSARRLAADATTAARRARPTSAAR